MQRLHDCELFLLDMDGTLYLGDEVFAGAREFVCGLAERGLKYIYLTNNSSRSGADYVRRLRGLGFPCAEDEVYTSSMATAEYLRENFAGATVFPVGTAAFCRELEQAGVALGSSGASVVAAAFDTELNYAKLSTAVSLLRKDAAFIAANPDLVCPMPAGEVLPDCGSICALLEAATGKTPRFIGKPNRSMIDILSARLGIPARRICCVGDRLYTDIAAAKNAGAVSALVMSGETTPQLLDCSDLKPDYVFADVAQLGRELLN